MKRPDKLAEGVISLHDNAPAHTCGEAKKILRKEYGWMVFDHAPYSPDQSPSDYGPFQPFKTKLRAHEGHDHPAEVEAAAIAALAQFAQRPDLRRARADQRATPDRDIPFNGLAGLLADPDDAVRLAAINTLEIHQ